MLGGLSFFFLSYRFGGVGERGGMVLLHVNGPPFFTTPFQIEDGLLVGLRVNSLKRISLHYELCHNDLLLFAMSSLLKLTSVVCCGVIVI